MINEMSFNTLFYINRLVAINTQVLDKSATHFEGIKSYFTVLVQDSIKLHRISSMNKY